MEKDTKFKEYFKKWYFWAVMIFLYLFSIIGEGRIAVSEHFGFLIAAFLISIIIFGVIFIIRKSLGSKSKE